MLRSINCIVLSIDSNLTKTKAQLVDIAKAHGILLYETNKNDMVEKLKDVKDIQRMIYQDSEYKLTK